MNCYLVKGMPSNGIFEEKEKALKYAITNQVPTHQVIAYRQRILHSDELHSLLQTALHYWNNQHSLQEAFLSTLEKNTDNLHYRVIAQLLRNGTSLGEALWPYLPDYFKPILAALKQPSGEEPKVTVIKSVISLIEDEQFLSKQFLRNFSYPVLVSQSALLMALANAFLNETNVLFSSILWGVMTTAQIAVFYLIKRGVFAKWYVRNTSGHRYETILSTLIAMIEIGEPLQHSLRMLCRHAHKSDQISLYRALILLEGGRRVQDCLPKQWFKVVNYSSSDSIGDTSDLITPLKQAKDAWSVSNLRNINLICKIIPILGIVIAATFVAYTLIQLYLPLMDISRLDH